MNRFIFFILFSFVGFTFSFAQNAEDIFHFAGNLYINGNNKGAKNEIEKGLQLFPNDPKLTSLKAKIKDEEEKQQKQKNEEQNNKEKQDKEQEQKDQQKEQQDNKNEQEQKQVPQNAGQISKEDAERLLNALEQQEKGVLEKLDKEKAKVHKTPAEKEW